MNNYNRFNSPNNLLPTLFKLMAEDLHIVPFWNNKIQKISDKLFLPSFENIKQTDTPKNLANSWFKIQFFENIEENKYKLITKKIEQHQNDIIKCRKIRLFFNKDQRKYIKQIIGTYRYFYNRTVSVLNNYDKNTKQSWFLVDPGMVFQTISYNNP